MSAKGLTIGTKVDGGAFRLPLELASLTSAVVGVRGSGKTVTVSVIVEELLDAGIPTVIVDPTDVWWGLKSSADGKKAGYPVVILGGTRGDLPLSDGSGGAIADFVVENPGAYILSLRHMRKARQRAFIRDFAEQLFHRKGEPEHRTPLFTVFDEASQYVPQRVDAAVAPLVGAIQDLVRLGRSAGLGIALIDQRPASVNKDVLTQLELLVAHRVTSPQDRKALLEWFEQHDAGGQRQTFLDKLASLPNGRAWFWSPLIDLFGLVDVRMRRTFDSSKTPKVGERRVEPKEMAAVDLEALRTQLAETVAEAEANDPKALRARVADLERQLRTAGRNTERDETAIARAVEAATSPLQAAFDEQERKYSAWFDNVRSTAGELLAKLDQLPAPVDAYDVLKHVPAPPRKARTLDFRDKAENPAAAARAPRAPAPSTNGGLTKPQSRILTALATFEVIGMPDVDRHAAAALAGYKPGSGHVNNTVGELSTASLIEIPAPGLLRLSDRGRNAADPLPVIDLGSYQDAWLALMKGPQKALMRVLLEDYPDAVTREDLAQRAGYKPGSGHVNNTVGELTSMRAAEVPQKGAVRASDILFPRALR